MARALEKSQKEKKLHLGHNLGVLKVRVTKGEKL